MAAHPHWRLLFAETTSSSSYLCVSELNFRATPGGGNLTRTGTASASNEYPGSGAANAFDGDAATEWLSIGGTVIGIWLRFSFGSAVAVEEITVQARASGTTHAPQTWDVQYSDDGSVWTTAWTVSNQTAWANGEIRTFSVPIEPVKVRKLHAFAVLAPPPASVAVQKLHAYAVIDDGSQPSYDPHWSNTVLLCHCDGAHNSTTLTDSSPSAHPITASGPIISTVQSKFGGASLSIASTYNSTNSAYATTGLSDFQFGSGRFTVEAWVRFTAFEAAQQHIICAGGWSSTGNLGWKFGWGAGQLRFVYSTTGSDSPTVGIATTPALNTWHHVAVDRDASNVIRVYFNGTVIHSATVASAIYASTDNFYLGNDGVLFRAVSGYIDDLRITKGVARYAGAFAVPIAAYPDTGPTVAVTRRRPIVAFLG